VNTTLAAGNRTLEAMDELTLAALEGDPELLAAGCGNFGGGGKGGEVNTCEKILANEVDLWRAGKRVRAVIEEGGTSRGGGEAEGGDEDHGEWMVSRIPLGGDVQVEVR
jgi:hypothetical protein